MLIGNGGSDFLPSTSNNPEDSFALFHDVNSNGDCDLNFLGIPTEPYGFSRNVQPVFKVPSFTETRMEIGLHTQIQIELIR